MTDNELYRLFSVIVTKIRHNAEVRNGVALSGGVKKRDLFAKPIGTYSRRPPESAAPLGAGLSGLHNTSPSRLMTPNIERAAYKSLALI